MRASLVLGFASLLGCASGANEVQRGPTTLGSDSTSDSPPANEEAGDSEIENTDEESSSSGEVLGSTTTGSMESSSTGTPTTTTSDGSSSGEESGSSSGGPTDVCMANAMDTECFACGRANCCSDVITCYADLECTCVLDCVEMGGSASACAGGCGQNAVVLGLVACVAANCENECSGI